ncbi:OmpA family protein [Hymenobacter sp. HMF4947]|uniref:OmpA family protein n=1 Tax=Hymenobacter ginkgonis TaxID=2682976 RepID=A0A7K1TBM7_9BACT|nr:OmpA family protein [Hymenobacter ginkgonis]MVN75804.1 OmpA family protein [Hymenobacter ginkgonis]
MKHLLFKTALCAAGVLAAAPRIHAQTADRKWGVSGYATTLEYRGDLGNNYFTTRNATYGGGLTLSHYLSKGIDINLSANQATLRYPGESGTFTAGGSALTNGRRFYANVSTFGLGFKFKLNNGWALKEDAVIQPYILLQPGFAYIYTDRYTGTYSGNQVLRSMNYGAFDGQAALGLTFRVTDGFSLFAQAGQHVIFRDDERLDGVSTGEDGFFNKRDQYLQFSAGVTANFGKGKDTDGDGVSDRKDKCPDTPTGVKVDENGCPLDTDGDGVADYQDKCPDVKGLAALQGCPDADGDGVADNDDKCPNTPAGVRVDASGCPVDSDGDGVADYQDKCPGTPAGVKVDATGCPLDRDGDGVPDFQDRCPDRAGPASNKGCPEIKAEAKKILNEATKYINFDFNKATLKSSSYPKLEQMVQIMNDYPDYSLSIAGHTDSKGADDYNLRLSYERAAAARKYMLSKGIPAERIEARGYGETKPIADNKTAAGQALNRRVDFDPYLTGETNAAEAKYGPAPSISELRATGQKLPGKKTTGTGAPRSRKAPAKKASARKK